MDKRTIREAGRKKAVRDRVRERRQEQPCRKSGTIMRQAGRYRAIDAAKTQVNEARDALIPEPDQEPYTATDKVETQRLRRGAYAPRLSFSEKHDEEDRDKM